MKKFIIVFLLLFLLAGCGPKTPDTTNYTVTFYDYYNEVVKVEEVKENDSATAPTLETIEGFTFDKWTEDYSNVTSDLTVKPEYTRNFYSVKFLDNDGTILKQENIEHGETITAPSVPILEGKEFQKWDKEYLVIKSDLIISPIYDDTTFEVIFKNKENEIIKTETVTYGNDATPPTLDNIEGYTFNGWSEDYTNVTSSITVNPKYIRNMYTVKFIDIDGNTLKEENIEHGEFIIAPPAPIIEGKTFNSWDKEFDNIKENLIISPEYTDITFIVSFYDSNNEIINSETVAYGKDATAPTDPEKEGYTFDGWTEDFTNVKKDLNVKPIFSTNKYTVVFKDNDDNILKTQKVEPGNNGTAPIPPLKDGYTFKEWDTNYQSVTSDLEIIAIYDVITYDIVFYNNLETTVTSWTNKNDFVNELYNDLFNWFKDNIDSIKELSLKTNTYSLTLNEQTASWTTPESLKDVDKYIYEKTISNFYYKPFTRITNDLHTPEVDNNYFLNSEPYRTKYLDLDRYFLSVINTAYPTYDSGYNHASSGRVQIFFRFQQWINGTNIAAFNSLPSKTDIDMQGAIIEIPAKLTYDITKSINIPNPIYENVLFLGWFDNKYGAGEPYTLIDTGNFGKIELYAKWDFDELTHEIIFVDNDNTLLEKYTINAGESINPKTLSNKIGYIFKGWDKSTMDIDKDITFRAEYDLIDYTITYNKNIDSENVILPTSPISYTVEDKFSLPKLTLEGYFFVGWYDNPNGNNDPIGITSHGNLNLYAKWVKINETNINNLEIVASDDIVLVGRILNLYVKNSNTYLNQNLISYYSEDNSIATIDSNGYLYAIKEGTVNILVVYENYQATISINITNEPLPIKWVGHRGSGGPVVENTVSAFELGGMRGYFAMESDVRVSADGVYYICHDDVFLSHLFTDSSLINKPMASYTWNELKELQVKSTYGGQTYYDKLITVSDYLDICKKYGAKAVLELKWTTGINSNDNSNLPGLVELVKSRGMYEDAIFMTSMKNCLTFLRANYADAQLQYLTGSSSTNMDNVEWCINNNVSLDAVWNVLTEEMVIKMHEAGLYVNAYTVNSQEAANNLIEIGVDMITTDHLGVE